MKIVQKKKITLSLALIIILTMTGSGCNGPVSSTTQTMGDGVTPAIFVQTLVSLANTGQISSSYANSALLKVDAPTVYAGWSSENFVIYDSASKTDIVLNTSTFLTTNPIDNYPTATAAAQDGLNFATRVYNGTIGLETVVPSTDPSGNTIYTGGTGNVYSQDGSTRDTDLQQAQLQQTSQQDRATQLASKLQMSFSSAFEIIVLADTIELFKANGTQLTSNDQAAVMQRLQGIAGVSQDELNTAMQSAVQGDMAASNAMLEKISANLGMPSGSLRDKILPQLGINLND